MKFQGYNWIFCSQLQIFWFYTLWNPNFGHFGTFFSSLGHKIHEMVHLHHLKWPMAVRRPFIMSIYGVSGVLMEYSARNCRYLYFRPFETLILVILRLFSPLGPNIQEMGHLQYLKWPMAVIRQFILSLYGVSGVLIEYSAHNCRYLDFRPFFT